MRGGPSYCVPGNKCNSKKRISGSSSSSSKKCPEVDSSSSSSSSSNKKCQSCSSGSERSSSGCGWRVSKFLEEARAARLDGSLLPCLCPKGGCRRREEREGRWWWYHRQPEGMRR